MAGIYRGTVMDTAPSTSVSLWNLEAAGGEACRVLGVYAAGKGKSANLVAFRIQWARLTGHATPSNITTLERIDSHVAAANAVGFVSFGTAGSLATGAFLDRMLQPYGGQIIWQAPELRRAWPLVGPAHATNTNAITCRPAIVSGGTNPEDDLMTDVEWEEIAG